LPLVLEGQSSATFEIQKEYFDNIDFDTKERCKEELNSIGFVDALDRRYSVPKKQMEEIIDESLTLPTARAFYARKDHPEHRVLAFQTIHAQTIMRRSKKLSLNEQLAQHYSPFSNIIDRLPLRRLGHLYPRIRAFIFRRLPG
jgi:hypothetical protein